MQNQRKVEICDKEERKTFFTEKQKIRFNKRKQKQEKEEKCSAELVHVGLANIYDKST